MPPAPGRGPAIVFRATMALVLANALWFIWSNRFVPMSDYPDWVYQGWTLSRILHGVSHPLYHFKSYPPTHAAVTIVTALLDYGFDPETSAKLVLSGAVCAFAIGSTYLLKACGAAERHPLLYVPLLFIFDTWFFTGEIDYYLALTGFFFLAGYLLRRADSPARINPLVVLAGLVAIFVGHLIAYLACGAVCIAIVLAHPSLVKARRLLLPALASAPILLWYVLGRAASHELGAQPLWVPWTARQLAANFIDAFSLFHAFAPWLSAHSKLMHIGAMCNLVSDGGFLTLFCVCAVRWFRGTRDHAACILAALLCLAGYLLGGYAIAGVFGAERLAYPAAWLVLAWLAGNWTPARESARLAAICVIGAALAIQCVYVDRAVGQVCDRLAQTYDRFAQAPSREDFCSIYEPYFQQSWGGQHRSGLERFVPDHASVIRLPYYLYIARGETAPIFDAGMFSYSGPGDNNNLCR